MSLYLIGSDTLLQLTQEQKEKLVVEKYGKPIDKATKIGALTGTIAGVALGALLFPRHRIAAILVGGVVGNVTGGVGNATWKVAQIANSEEFKNDMKMLEANKSEQK